jgi:hypothetical protein
MAIPLHVITKLKQKIEIKKSRTNGYTIPKTQYLPESWELYMAILMPLTRSHPEHEGKDG